jgi:hypothetical protein
LIRSKVQTFSESNVCSFVYFSNKEKHNPCSGIEISDWEFSEQKIGDNIAETEFLESPFSPESVISFTSMIFIGMIRQTSSFELNIKCSTLLSSLLA